jgi:hypothetical protein
VNGQQIGVVICLRDKVPAGPPGWATRGEQPSSWDRIPVVVGEKYEIKGINNPDEDVCTRIEIQAKDSTVINVSAWTVWSYGVFEFAWDKEFLEQHPALRIFRKLGPNK